MQILPFKADDFFALTPQPAQAWTRGYVTREQLQRMEGPNAWTGWAQGKPVWCFGWWQVYPTRAVVWAFIDKDAGPHFAAIHRYGQALVDSLPHQRVETEVDWDFDEGHRWVRLLGFKMEAARLTAHRADGGDSALYARIK